MSGPYIPGTTVEEIVNDMLATPRAPTREALNALIYRVVSNTSRYLRRERLGTLTVDRYIVQEDRS